MIVQYERTRPDALKPTRGHPSDAGLDVYYCPEDASTTGHMIKPGESVLLQSGLKFEVPHGYMLEVKNRSSIAALRSLVVGACVIDSGYSGEVFINLHNIGNEDQVVEKGTKIAQLVMVPIISFRPREISGESLYRDSITISDRGPGALGSTNE